MSTREPFATRGIRAWGDVRGRREGGIAFLLMRLTGLGLVAYLYLHLYVLRLLTQGPEAWDAFVARAKTVPFLALDGVLLFGILFHALNGVRALFLELGIGVPRQRSTFWAVLLLSLAGTALGLWGIAVAVR